MVVSRSHRVRSALALIVLIGACSIDARLLSRRSAPIQAEAGAGGSSGSDAGAAGSGTAGTSDGGSTAQAPTNNADAGASSGKGECPDLDRNGIRDCEETLVKNSTFERDDSEWQLESPQVSSWDEHGSGDRAGSLLISNADTLKLSTATQCVRIQADERYLMSAETSVEAPADSGFSQLHARFYDTKDCSGNTSGFGVSGQVGVARAWTTLSGLVTAPSGSQSLLIRLVVARRSPEDAVFARFDNVLLRHVE